MRSQLVRIHLFLGAFFLPALLLMATSGGLYLFGFKGSIQKEAVEIQNVVPLDPDSPDLKQDIDGFLQSNGIVHTFDYVRVSGSMLTTRPTSRDFYTIDVSGAEPVVTFNQPDWVKRLIVLHVGHGPEVFKLLQKVMAFGLMAILLTGFYLGVSSPGLRNQTLGITGAGLVVSLLFAFFL